MMVLTSSPSYPHNNLCKVPRGSSMSGESSMPGGSSMPKGYRHKRALRSPFHEIEDKFVTGFKLDKMRVSGTPISI
jgi:hypothetical protein